MAFKTFFQNISDFLLFPFPYSVVKCALFISEILHSKIYSDSTWQEQRTLRQKKVIAPLTINEFNGFS